MVSVILVVIIIIMLCKPKSKIVTEGFSSPRDKKTYAQDTETAVKYCNTDCKAPFMTTSDGTEEYSYCPTVNVSLADYNNYLKKGEYPTDMKTTECNLSDVIHSDDYIYSKEEWLNDKEYTREYCHDDCNGISTHNDDESIYSCDTKKINNIDEFNKRLHSSNLDSTNFTLCNKNQDNKPESFLIFQDKQEKLVNSKIDSSLLNYKKNFPEKFTDKNTNNFKYTDRTIKKIISLKNKTSDIVNSKNNNQNIGDQLKESFKKYDNFYPIALEVCSNYNKAILDADNKVTTQMANNILKEIYQSFKKDKIVDIIFGNPTNIKEFERIIKEQINVDLTDPVPINGVTVDKFGNLREHSRRNGGCYLITALTKAKLLSIGQVYQLRKLMLEAFKVMTNRPFFSFYYENFESVADMLVKENRLSEILPNMLKCIDLSKNGQFDLAFEQYIITARQAYQICKDMGMDTKDLEDKFEQLDGTIDVLPEPNSLFVENGFREAIKSC